jgi:hypothetical protein|nr:MAG TPA: hypothetical protein [Caudoviricetes sp.]
MIGDRQEKGYRTGQIKGKDYIYVTGMPGMGGSAGNKGGAPFRCLWWAIEAHKLAVLNTKLEIVNDNFELFDRYIDPKAGVTTNTAQPYRILLSVKAPVGDTVDSSAVKSSTDVAAGAGIGKTLVADETMLPQPTDAGYNGKIYVIIDMLSAGKAPLGDKILNDSSEYEAMRTKVYDYEARL